MPALFVRKFQKNERVGFMLVLFFCRKNKKAWKSYAFVSKMSTRTVPRIPEHILLLAVPVLCQEQLYRFLL